MEATRNRNIVIGDETALFALLHSDWANQMTGHTTVSNPLMACAETLGELSAFNIDNPFYGQQPISLLIPSGAQRRATEDVFCRFAPPNLPAQSFFPLREGLYMATPEFTFVRMARFKTEIQLALIAMNLCARYYLDVRTGTINDRHGYLTTPDKLRSYCLKAQEIRGSKKAIDALRWVYPNSGSPEESRLQLLLTLPLSRGGFALPFDSMNYDVKAGRLARIAEQSRYSIDCANSYKRIGVEYDGGESHQDSSADKRRRNELKALGWDIFPLEKDVLQSPDRMANLAEIVGKALGKYPRHSRLWPTKYLNLRQELGLRV